MKAGASPRVVTLCYFSCVSNSLATAPNEVSGSPNSVNPTALVNRESSRDFVVSHGVAGRKGLFGSVARAGQRRTLPPADFENAAKHGICSKKAEIKISAFCVYQDRPV